MAAASQPSDVRPSTESDESFDVRSSAPTVCSPKLRLAASLLAAFGVSLGIAYCSPWSPSEAHLPFGHEDSDSSSSHTSLSGVEEGRQLASVPSLDMVYLRISDKNLYAHTHGGSAYGNRQTLHGCPKENDHPNCFWQVEPSYDNEHFYLKASDKDLYLHVWGGVHSGYKFRLHPCPKQKDHPNCQFKLEKSPTNANMVYIKVKGANLYMHAHGGSAVGHELTLHPCPKANNHPNCQWEIQPYCQDAYDKRRCTFWKKKNMCSKLGKYCRKTCGRCFAGTPEGRWEKWGEGANTELTLSESVSVTTTTGKELSVMVGWEISSTVSTEMSFGIASASASLTATARGEVSRALSSSLARGTTVSREVTCQSGSGEKHWLYRWVVQVGDKIVKTDTWRCHVAKDGIKEPAPGCPAGFCGDALCDAAKCRQWKA